MGRIAVLDMERCQPRRCGLPCTRYCPQIRMQVNAIEFDPEKDRYPIIVEPLCTGCGICVKKCPFEALHIVRLPDELEKSCSYRYGINAFKLYRLPVMSMDRLTGLIGKNGVGKTTSLRILAGDIKPNLGNPENPPDWDEIIKFYRGSVLQEYFRRLSEGRLKAVYKPQHVDAIPRAVRGAVSKVLSRVDERGKFEQVTRELQLKGILDRDIRVLSGGELQRVAIAVALLRDVDAYLFDEPSSHLDVYQRIKVGRAIRGLVREGKMVIVAEHDLALLDYLSDQVCILYGEPDVFGIVSKVHGVREGINVYIQGFIPSENVRIRKKSIQFPVRPPEEPMNQPTLLSWMSSTKSYDEFKLDIEAGSIAEGEVVGIVGPNGIGKTTFVKLLAGIEEPDAGKILREGITISYKPQYLKAVHRGKVKGILRKASGTKFKTDQFRSEILEPLGLTRILDKDVTELSGGELQRVAIAACLSRDALIYLLDEPSAYLDIEERLAMAKAIRDIVSVEGKAALVVEHDIILCDFIADRIMVFSGEPGRDGTAGAPVSLKEGINEFLRSCGITFRRDAITDRPRINKPDSRLDRLQKASGEYYYVGD